MEKWFQLKILSKMYKQILHQMSQRNSVCSTHVCSFVLTFIFLETIRHLQLKHNIWQNTMIWRKTCTDWLTDSLSELAENEHFWRNRHVQPHTNISYTVFFSGLWQNQCQVGQYSEISDSLCCCDTLTDWDGGQRSLRSSMFDFVQKILKERERMKETDNTKKTNILFLKSPTHLTRNHWLYNMKPRVAVS